MACNKCTFRRGHRHIVRLLLSLFLSFFLSFPPFFLNNNPRLPKITPWKYIRYGHIAPRNLIQAQPPIPPPHFSLPKRKIPILLDCLRLFIRTYIFAIFFLSLFQKGKRRRKRFISHLFSLPHIFVITRRRLIVVVVVVVSVRRPWLSRLAQSSPREKRDKERAQPAGPSQSSSYISRPKSECKTRWHKDPPASQQQVVDIIIIPLHPKTTRFPCAQNATQDTSNSSNHSPFHSAWESGFVGEDEEKNNNRDEKKRVTLRHWVQQEWNQ